VHRPAHADEAVLRLPDAPNLHIQLLKEDAPVEPQGPENQPVVFDARKCVARVPERYVISIDVICKSPGAVRERGVGGAPWVCCGWVHQVAQGSQMQQANQAAW
jgi:hypothetical protein